MVYKMTPKDYLMYGYDYAAVMGESGWSVRAACGVAEYIERVFGCIDRKDEFILTAAEIINLARFFDKDHFNESTCSQ